MEPPGLRGLRGLRGLPAPASGVVFWVSRCGVRRVSYASGRVLLCSVEVHGIDRGISPKNRWKSPNSSSRRRPWRLRKVYLAKLTGAPTPGRRRRASIRGRTATGREATSRARCRAGTRPGSPPGPGVCTYTSGRRIEFHTDQPGTSCVIPPAPMPLPGSPYMSGSLSSTPLCRAPASLPTRPDEKPDSMGANVWGRSWRRAPNVCSDSGFPV